MINMSILAENVNFMNHMQYFNQNLQLNSGFEANAKNNMGFEAGQKKLEHHNNKEDPSTPTKKERVVLGEIKGNN